MDPHKWLICMFYTCSSILKAYMFINPVFRELVSDPHLPSVHSPQTICSYPTTNASKTSACTPSITHNTQTDSCISVWDGQAKCKMCSGRGQVAIRWLLPHLLGPEHWWCEDPISPLSFWKQLSTVNQTERQSMLWKEPLLAIHHWLHDGSERNN